MSLYDLIKSFLSNGWQFFSIKYPGTDLTFANIALGTVLILLSIRFIKFWFGFGDGSPSGGSGYGSGSTESHIKPRFQYKRNDKR